MTTGNRERRVNDREPLMLKVEYPGVDDLLHDYTQNISRGGTFILTQRDLAVGTKVRVRFEFERVHNGRHALEMLHQQRFDLVIADVYLPIMDGAQLIRALRSDPALAQLPVIAVSAGGKSAHEMATAAGADFFVEKPMRLQEILRTVKKLVAL